MADLRDALTGLGYDNVRTYLQSGNVVLGSDEGPQHLQAELAGRLSARLGMDLELVVRSRDELAAVLARDPLAGVATNPRLHQVTFLSGEPDPTAVRKLADAELGADCYVHDGREIHAWHPDGIHASPLAKLLAKLPLGVVATARNWNTVTALLALADA